MRLHAGALIALALFVETSLAKFCGRCLNTPYRSVGFLLELTRVDVTSEGVIYCAHKGVDGNRACAYNIFNGKFIAEIPFYSGPLGYGPEQTAIDPPGGICALNSVPLGEIAGEVGLADFVGCTDCDSDFTVSYIDVPVFLTPSHPASYPFNFFPPTLTQFDSCRRSVEQQLPDVCILSGVPRNQGYNSLKIVSSVSYAPGGDNSCPNTASNYRPIVPSCKEGERIRTTDPTRYGPYPRAGASIRTGVCDALIWCCETGPPPKEPGTNFCELALQLATDVCDITGYVGSIAGAFCAPTTGAIVYLREAFAQVVNVAGAMKTVADKAEPNLLPPAFALFALVIGRAVPQFQALCIAGTALSLVNTACSGALLYAECPKEPTRHKRMLLDDNILRPRVSPAISEHAERAVKIARSASRHTSTSLTRRQSSDVSACANFVNVFYDSFGFDACQGTFKTIDCSQLEFDDLLNLGIPEDQAQAFIDSCSSFNDIATLFDYLCPMVAATDALDAAGLCSPDALATAISAPLPSQRARARARLARNKLPSWA